MPITVREMTPDDRAGVLAIDTSFETPTIFDLVTSPRRLELVERRLATPLTKRFPIADAFAHWATWDTAWVAVDAAAPATKGPPVVGFAAVEYAAWHSRLVLWHLYVQPAYRRNGVGRALVARVEEHGRSAGARHVWLETSNVNVPGIAAYERLGYSLCGADATMYETLPYADETALFLAKPLR